MHAFTLRLEADLAKKLEFICKKRGYSKTGLVKSLIRDFVEKDVPASLSEQSPRHGGEKKGLAALAGIVSWGGDSVKDKREHAYF